MTSEGLSADMCVGKFLLVSMGVRVEGLACADPGARTPIGASGIIFILTQLQQASQLSPSLSLLWQEKEAIKYLSIAASRVPRRTCLPWEASNTLLSPACPNLLWCSRVKRPITKQVHGAWYKMFSIFWSRTPIIFPKTDNFFIFGGRGTNKFAPKF